MNESQWFWMRTWCVTILCSLIGLFLVGCKPVGSPPRQTADSHGGVKVELKVATCQPTNLPGLGDAILGAVIAKYLFVSVPGANEGYLTKMRSKIVRRDQLNKIGKDLKLIRLMRSKEDLSKFSDNTNGNLLESIIGAVCLDMGYLACEKFIYSKIINPYIDISSLEGRIMSYKSLIVEWCQKNKKSFKFNCIEEESKENLKHFSATLQIDSKTVGKARSTSRKKAEEKACKRAFFALQNKIQPVIK